MKYLLFVFGMALVTGCSSSHKIAGSRSAGDIHEIRFMNEFVLPNAMSFKGTTVGGLSGIDYDSNKDIYYMISDDPSSHGPSRFYTAKIPIGKKGIDSVEIADVTILKDSRGQPYPDITKDRIHSADLEAIRYDPTRDEMVWSSEGQRVIKNGKKELQDPAITIIGRNGFFKDSFELPANMHIQAEEKGPRHNSVFEGVTFDENYRNVFVSVEDAIYEDGPRAGIGKDSSAWVRILKFDRKTKKQTAQYAYEIDPVPYPADPPGAFKVNGISDILYIGNNKLLVIERAFSTGRTESDVRLYIADLKNAEDVSSVSSLKSQPSKRPVTKKLLLDMNSTGRFIDNVEGVTFGPLLSDGHRSLIFVVDDNFDKRQKSQFFLFEVL
jgi:hypothetical protein